jgi:hypothetical protein
MEVGVSRERQNTAISAEYPQNIRKADRYMDTTKSIYQEEDNLSNFLTAETRMIAMVGQARKKELESQQKQAADIVRNQPDNSVEWANLLPRRHATKPLETQARATSRSGSRDREQRRPSPSPSTSRNNMATTSSYNRGNPRGNRGRGRGSQRGTQRKRAASPASDYSTEEMRLISAFRAGKAARR